MATTDKYDLEEVSYGTQGWNGILTTNLEKVDDHLHTRLLITLGETVVKGDALYLDHISEKWKKAQGDGSKQPMRCFATEAGVLDDEIRGQRVGPMTKSGWAFQVGYNLYLSTAVAGAITHNKPGSNIQVVGWASGAAELFIDIQDYEEMGHPTSTTTSTTTTTTTTTTSTTTTTTTTTTTSTTTTTTTTA